MLDLWRGGAISGFLHVTLFVGLIFGLPSLPVIFDREFLDENEDISVAVEVVTPEALRQLDVVLALPDAQLDTSPSASTEGKPAPLVLTPLEMLRDADAQPTPQTRSATTRENDKADGAGSGRAVQIPAGEMDPRNLELSRAPRPDSDRTETTRSVAVVAASEETERHRSDGKRSEKRNENAPQTAADEQRQQRDERRPETAAADRSQAASSAPDARQAPRQARSASGNPQQGGLPSEPQAAAERRTQQASDETTARGAVPSNAAAPAGPDGSTAPASPSPSAPEAARAAQSRSPEQTAQDRQTPLSPGASPRDVFIASVAAEERMIVENIIAADRRLQDALTLRDADIAIPATSKALTLQRLQRTADSGHAPAQYNLAGKYLRGEDVDRDFEQARKLLSKAAEQGYSPAQTLLGLMRLTGAGLPRDLAESSFWWSLAADRGGKGAKLGLELIQNKLKPSEVIKANRLRLRWGRLITDYADAKRGETNQRDLNAELQAASERGDSGAVLSLLARGADPESAGTQGRNALISAAWRGRREVMHLLLERGTRTDFTDGEGRTPLMWAAINGHPEVVTELLSNGANPNHLDAARTTALMRAAWNGHTEVVRQLIEARANLNEIDINGLTALAYARREGRTGIARMLIDAGAR